MKELITGSIVSNDRLCANGNSSIRLFCVRFVVCHSLMEVHKYPRHSCRKGKCDQYIPRGAKADKS